MKDSYKKIISEANHTFELRKINGSNKYHFQQIIVPLLKEGKSIKNTKKYPIQQLCLPKWNDDGLCYTPSFIIPQDRIIFQRIKNTLKEGYLEQIQRSCMKSINIPDQNIRLPYPRDQNYCGVCKIKYINFQQHIDSLAHKSKCLNSPYTLHINQLCLQVGNSEFLNNFIQQKQLNKLEEFNKTQYSFCTFDTYQISESSQYRPQKVTEKQISLLINNQQFQATRQLQPQKRRAIQQQ